MPSTAEPISFEDRSESSLSKVAEKFRVVLFGLGKTLYAPPDQPALQILLQYRNLYELSMREVQQRVERNEQVPDAVHHRTLDLLDRMWRIVIDCMREYNKGTTAKARLLSAEKMAMMRITAPTYTVPNPGYTKIKPTHPPAQDPPDDLIVLEPKDPDV